MVSNEMAFNLLCGEILPSSAQGGKCSLPYRCICEVAMEEITFSKCYGKMANPKSSSQSH